MCATLILQLNGFQKVLNYDNDLPQYTFFAPRHLGNLLWELDTFAAVRKDAAS